MARQQLESNQLQHQKPRWQPKDPTISLSYPATLGDPYANPKRPVNPPLGRILQGFLETSEEKRQRKGKGLAGEHASQERGDHTHALESDSKRARRVLAKITALVPQRIVIGDREGDSGQKGITRKGLKADKVH
ncbi:hypothetical protein QYF36_008754 [Acer negundo]|nr:hypothetical protein QYF36_008754 [Acer negundo]